MKKIISTILVFFVLFSQIIVPVDLKAIENSEYNNIHVAQVKEDINLDDIVILSGTEIHVFMNSDSAILKIGNHEYAIPLEKLEIVKVQQYKEMTSINYYMLDKGTSIVDNAGGVIEVKNTSIRIAGFEEEGEIYYLIGDKKFKESKNVDNTKEEYNKKTQHDSNETKFTGDKSINEDQEKEVGNKEKYQKNTELKEDRVIEKQTGKQTVYDNEENAQDNIEIKSEKKSIDKDSVKTTIQWGKYFEAIQDNVPIYDNSSGELVEIGFLIESQAYPIKRDYGNWWEIEFGNNVGYVAKSKTKPTNKTLKSEKLGEKNSQRTVITKSDVIVYDNTGNKLEAFGKVKKGTKYSIVSSYGNWWKVLFAGRVGYIAKSQTNASFIQGDKSFKVINSDVPIYDNRTGKLIQVGSLTKGQVYPIKRDYGNWWEIEFNNYVGYVAKNQTEYAPLKIKNLKKNESNSQRTVTLLSEVVVYDNTGKKLTGYGKIKKGTKYPVVSSYGNWWKVLFAGRVGYIAKSQTKANFLHGDKYFKIINSDVPIYDNRAGKLIQVGSLTKGQVYPIKRDYGNWWEIEFNNHFGYVAKNQTEYATPTLKNLKKNEINSKRTVTTQTDIVVYDNTGLSLKGYGKISKGTDYHVVSSYGNWWKVLFAGRIGYISKSQTKANFIPGDNSFKVLKSDVPVYDNRTGSLIKVGSLTKGQAYPIKRDYGNWWAIQFGNIEGYILKSNTEYFGGSIRRLSQHSNGTTRNKILIHKTNTIVYDNSSDSLKPIGRVEQGVEYPLLRSYGNWWEISFAGRIAYISKNNAIDSYGDEKEAFIVTNNVGVYDNRSGSLEKVAELEEGETFLIKQDYGNWWGIEYSNFTGYVLKSSTQKVKSYKENFERKPLYSVDIIRKTEVYDNSTGKLVQIGTLQGNNSYYIIRDYSPSWYEINFGGRKGYIRKSFTMAPSSEFKDYVSREVKINKTSKIRELNTLFYRSNQNYINISDRIVNNGQFYIENYGEFNLRKNKKGSYIEWDHNPTNTRSYFRILHSHFFLYDLVDAYKETKDRRYIEEGNRIINDWLLNNSFSNHSNEMAWHDETTARRLVSWVYFYDTAKSVLDINQINSLFSNIAYHAELLSKDTFHTTNTNHGMFQDEALIVFSDYFSEFKKSKEYKVKAKDRLWKYFNYIISTDGVHLEHSPAYNQMISNSLKKYANYFSNGNDDIGNQLLKKYLSMAKYNTFVIKPDGYFPAVGDTFFNERPSNGIHEDNQYYQYSLTQGKEGLMPAETSAIFKDAGYAIMRDNWSLGKDATYIHFTAAYHTSYHKHSDDLSVWLYANGHDLVTEAGPNGYDYENPFTSYGYSTFAHNTLAVNDKGLPRVDGLFDHTYLESGLIEGNITKATGVNKRYKDVIHKRSLVYDKFNRNLTVDDEISSDKENNYKIFWHLASGVTPIIEGNQVKLIKDGVNHLTMTVEGEDIELKAVKEQLEPYILGYQFNGIHQMESVYTLIIETNESNANIRTIFDIHNVFSYSL